MIDLKEFLEKHGRLLNDELNSDDGVRILSSRPEIISAAKGTLRKAMQDQLLNTIRNFNQATVPDDPMKIS
ncbi:MAG: hypothetical protein HQM10_16270 [Candidatus Riflebacteria bacterium]|nr:hypothetical protein [Candidatus Riflebacteria bacterium]